MERSQYAEKLEPRVGDIYDGISKGREAVSLRYAPAVKGPVRRLFIPGGGGGRLSGESCAAPSGGDVRTGFTSLGPHRDDLELEIGGVSARVYGSQGQQRSLVQALKLAEAEMLHPQFGGDPPSSCWTT